MDTETLIAKVQLKPEIWDKRLKVHSNRVVVDRCWKEIANQMGYEEAAMRKKWKYLRDQFSVEFGKINKISRSGGPGCEPLTPKWPHYKSLLFLKDIVKPRASSSNLATAKTSAVLDEQTNNTEIEELDENLNGNESLRETSGASDEPESTQLLSVILTENYHSSREDRSERMKRRRIPSNDKRNETVLEMENRKVQLFEKVLTAKSKPENDDELFFRSLLPHVAKIPDNIKLTFRNRIQEIVEQFAYHAPSSHQRSCNSQATAPLTSFPYQSSCSCYVTPASQDEQQSNNAQSPQ